MTDEMKLVMGLCIACGEETLVYCTDYYGPICHSCLEMIEAEKDSESGINED